MKSVHTARGGAPVWDRDFRLHAGATPSLEPQNHQSGNISSGENLSPRDSRALEVLPGTLSRRPAGTNIDLKLLAIVNELHRTRSVSHTAENLRLSQSTISMSLAKLRRHFNDPLFVRTSTGMEPTPHALEVLMLLRKAEGLIQSALEYHYTFDASTSTRLFHICSTDIAQLTLLPTLVKKLKQVAPSIEIHLSNICESLPRRLESGEVDLAIGFIPSMGAGFYQQRLFRDRFVCAVRTGHPRIKNSLTLEQFEQESQVIVTTSGTGHNILDRTLDMKRIRRKVALRVPGFLGLASILIETNYLAVLPQQLGTLFAKSSKITLLPPPFNISPYFILQHWHERYNYDSANVWFRGIMAELFLQ